MYEENLTALRQGNLTEVFAEQLAKMRLNAVAADPGLSPANVLQWGNRANQPVFASVCRRLLLPGSRIVGYQSLAELAGLAKSGRACLLCLQHISNSDVPNLFTLLVDQGTPEVFQQIVWIAGRKLDEDCEMTRMVAQCWNRLVLTPPSWLAADHTADELVAARRINRAVQRTMLKMRHEGWIFGLFPSGTRMRPNDRRTARAIDEIDSYLKVFEFLLLGNIEGCTVPVSKDRGLIYETPQLARVEYRFGKVMPTKLWRREAAERFGGLTQREASVRAMTEEINGLVTP